MEKLLELLEQDCTMSIEQVAAAAGMPVEEAKAAIRKYEDERIVLGYQAISTGTGSGRRQSPL